MALRGFRRGNDCEADFFITEKNQWSPEITVVTDLE